MPLNTATPNGTRISAPAPLATAKRHHAENEGEGGHEDGPQPRARGLDHRFQPALALVFQLLGELHHQDRVLGSQADQHHKADLGEDVVVQIDHPQADQRGKQAHGHDQQNGQRQRPTFVLRGQDHEHEQHGQGEDQLAQQVLLGRSSWKLSSVHS